MSALFLLLKDTRVSVRIFSSYPMTSLCWVWVPGCPCPTSVVKQVLYVNISAQSFLAEHSGVLSPRRLTKRLMLGRGKAQLVLPGSEETKLSHDLGQGWCFLRMASHIHCNAVLFEGTKLPERSSQISVSWHKEDSCQGLEKENGRATFNRTPRTLHVSAPDWRMVSYFLTTWETPVFSAALRSQGTTKLWLRAWKSSLALLKGFQKYYSIIKKKIT